MSKLKDILVETRNTACEIRNAQNNDYLTRAQIACQIWNLNQMIKIANCIEHMSRRLRNKHR